MESLKLNFVLIFVLSLMLVVSTEDEEWCEKEGAECEASSDCCSKKCTAVFDAKGFKFVCLGSTYKECVEGGDTCKLDEHCCSRRCHGFPSGSSRCFGTQDITSYNCIIEDEPCIKDVQCCSKICGAPGKSNQCIRALLSYCVEEGRKCVINEDCCSRRCVQTRQRGLVCLGPNIKNPHACNDFYSECTVSLECCRGYFCERSNDSGFCNWPNIAIDLD